MLPTLALLLSCQLVGEISVRTMGLPLPGPVVGLVLLLILIGLRPAIAEGLRPTTSVILANLSLLFVPAGVGVMVHAERLGGEWLPIAVALVASTLLTLLAVALTMRLAVRLLGLGEEDDAGR